MLLSTVLYCVVLFLFCVYCSHFTCSKEMTAELFKTLIYAFFFYSRNINLVMFGESFIRSSVNRLAGHL